MNAEEMKSLQQGDVIRRKGQSHVFIVHANFTEWVTAIRTVDLTNAGEWEIGSTGLAGLHVGQVVDHKAPSGSKNCVVVGVYGERATAVVAADIADPSDWELVGKATLLPQL